MSWRTMLALLFMLAAAGPATAQRGGTAPETLDRQTDSSDKQDLMWNLVGLLGLVGLIGLLPQHEEDSYHPSSFDE